MKDLEQRKLPWVSEPHKFESGNKYRSGEAEERAASLLFILLTRSKFCDSGIQGKRQLATKWDKYATYRRENGVVGGRDMGGSDYEEHRDNRLAVGL